MPVQTRTQRDYALAARLVADVAERTGQVPRIYGGLWHALPALVRTAGLAQAAAFHHAKSTGQGERALAHSLLLAHLAALAGVDDIAHYAQTADTRSYQLATRRVLDGAVFFRRLSTSLLGATSTDTEAG